MQTKRRTVGLILSGANLACQQAHYNPDDPSLSAAERDLYQVLRLAEAMRPVTASKAFLLPPAAKLAWQMGMRLQLDSDFQRTKNAPGQRQF